MRTKGSKLRIWLISDTHGKENLLDCPKGIDMIIHAGDMGTYKSPIMCEEVIHKGLKWLSSLDVKHKIFIAGNHDTSIEAGLIKRSDVPANITYLEHESCEIEGFKIFGSPYTPAFNQWAFNVKRSRLDEYWKDIPDNTDILITHGPPLGILDKTESGTENLKIIEGKYAFIEGNRIILTCGDKALLNHVYRVKPLLHVFGHIHSEEFCPNAGILELPNIRTKFINASVLDLDYKLVNNGFVVEV